MHSRAAERTIVLRLAACDTAARCGVGGVFGGENARVRACGGGSVGLGARRRRRAAGEGHCGGAPDLGGAGVIDCRDQVGVSVWLAP